MPDAPPYRILAQGHAVDTNDAGELVDGVRIDFIYPLTTGPETTIQAPGRVFVPGTPPDNELARRLIMEYVHQGQAIAAPPDVAL